VVPPEICYIRENQLKPTIPGVFMIRLFLAAILASLIGTTNTFASSCQGEAQIIAKIGERKTNSLSYCTAFVDISSVTFYQESGVCPLPLEVVLQNGIQFPLKNGHDCDIQKGDSLSGVLVLKNDRIELE
jgi:hypothetical protein